MQVKLYSLEPLPISLRGTFELPEWPYIHGVGHRPSEKFLEYLQRYKVFLYRDDYLKFPDNIIIPVDGEDLSQRDEQFWAFMTWGWIDDETLQVIDWPYVDHKGNSTVNSPLARKIREKGWGDAAWGDWNRKVLVGYFDHQKIKIIQGHYCRPGEKPIPFTERETELANRVEN